MEKYRMQADLPGRTMDIRQIFHRHILRSAQPYCFQIPAYRNTAGMNQRLPWSADLWKERNHKASWQALPYCRSGSDVSFRGKRPSDLHMADPVPVERHLI